ncbi:hypothetical protein CQ047_12020 [Microbacterium sp. MYb72]|nr:hypothetical protein CQ047_12020 [Microbacterium sp. MYb72]
MKDPLGARFAVAGNWLYDGDEPHRSRTVGGTFRVAVLADSAEKAIEEVAEMMRRDIIVTALEIVR